MIGTGIDVRVKIQDIVSSQLPSYVLSESPLTDDFLKQFYVSQEFQGGAVDFASNLDQYLDINNLSSEAIYGEFELTQDVSVDDTVVFVNTTKSFPDEWGLLKVNNEIMTYTGLTTNSFTGVVRGFSGVVGYKDDANPGNLVFQTSEAAPHLAGDSLDNLSTLFLKEFYNKLKFTFAPGFEDLEEDADLDIGNWIRQVRAFFQTKGSKESIEILFKVLYGEKPTVVDLEDFLLKPSTADYSRRDYVVAQAVLGNPLKLKGRSITQDNDVDIIGTVSEIEPFTRDGELYYKILLFVSNDEIEVEKKLFSVPGQSRAHRPWNQGDPTLTVDTTIGFRDNGKFITEDGIEFTYTDRTVNQFLGVECSDPNKAVLTNDKIIDGITVFGYTSEGERVYIRLTGVLSGIDFDEGEPLSFVGEKIVVDTLGENITNVEQNRGTATLSQIIANSFVYNTSVRFQVASIQGSTFKIETNFLDKAFIRVGDSVDILQRGSQVIFASDRTVTAVDESNSTIDIDNSFGIPLDQPIDIRRVQKYARSRGAQLEYGNNELLTNVLNVYDASRFDSNFYVATNSLPSYRIKVDVVESVIDDLKTNNFRDFNSFTGKYQTLVFDSDVDFYTGDLITYSTTEDATPIIEPGQYYVEVRQNRRRVRLYVSPSFIGSDSFVGLEENNDPGSHFFTLSRQSSRIISGSDTFRKIPILENNASIDRTPQEAETGVIAVLTNGVEILSYKSPSKIFLGPLESIDAVSGGEGYSVVTPPEIIVSEPDVQISDGSNSPVIPTTAVAEPVIQGKLEQIYIDPQDFDIDEVFSITVTGGNSGGASAEPILERKGRSIFFDTRLVDVGGGISPTDDTILFETNHNLGRGDIITYNNKGNASIGISSVPASNISNGTTLSNRGTYYVDIINNRTIRLFDSLADLQDNNYIGFTTNLTGFGIQSFETPIRTSIIGANIIEDGGSFTYRNMRFTRDNVFVEYDEIRYPSHGFSTGDLVEYDSTGNIIGGMSRNRLYFVVAVDEDTIKVCNAGADGTNTSNFERRNFVNFTSDGNGFHSLKYPDVKAEVVFSSNNSGLSTVVATPVIRGEIIQVYTEDGGFYGSDIINFQKNPKIDVVRGSGARVKPSVVNGEVVAFQILNGGVNYPNSPDLVVTDTSGSGQGALLRAVVENGRIVDVIIIRGGISYNENTTKIEVVDPSKNAILVPRIRSLTINLNSRFGFEILNNSSYNVVSYDRVIREGVYNDFGLVHSPIIGWANDGNPIYGGFALSDPEDFNSGFRAMKTAYDLNADAVFGRPSQLTYPAGFFVEDYEYTDNGDLDEYNGRFCRTPEFPNGVYAYFAGISTDLQSQEREPQFPYFIGDKYRDSPIDPANTRLPQDFDLTGKPIYRNTFPYSVGNPFVGSEFLTQSYLFDKQESVVETLNPGDVQDISIVGAGVSYRVGDVPIFDRSQDSLNTVISEVEGKEVEQIAESILSYVKTETKVIRKNDKTIRVYVDPFHEFKDNDNVVISGVSTQTVEISGSHVISVDNRGMSLYSPIEPDITPPSVTDIFVNFISDNLSVGSEVVIGTGSAEESVSVLNIFPINKALRVLRPVAYSLVHGIGTAVNVVPNYFEFESSVGDFDSSLDESYYFNPKQTVGTGITIGESVEKTFSIGNISVDISVESDAIYAPGHSFIDLEEVVFSKETTANVLQVDDEGVVKTIPTVGNEENLFVKVLSENYIALRKNRNSRNVVFTSDGSDNFQYNIKSQRFAETVNVDRIDAVVTTLEGHQLNNGDLVSINVVAQGPNGIGVNPNVKVEFDDVSQSLIIDPRSVGPSKVDTDDDLITIEDHGYVTGDYLLYQNDGNVIEGLEENQKYFVIVFDVDRFFLARTEIDTKFGSENPVNLLTTGNGVHRFSKVNPEIVIVRNHDIVFDISDSSLDDRELNFFFDQTQTEIFESNGIDSDFIVKTGQGNNRKTITFSNNNPDTLYYGISQGGFISTSDTNAPNFNSIKFVDSAYSLKGRATVKSDNEFSVSLQKKPEKSVYQQESSSISYNTSSPTAFGGVGKVRILSSGNTFIELPEFVTILSEFGNNGSLKAVSDDIGKVSSFRIQNPGWGYSADTTLTPRGTIQPAVEFGSSDAVNSIDVLDGGSGYQTEPLAVIVDSVTREVVDSGSLTVELQSTTVSNVVIEVTPTGLSKNVHELYTTDNTNGIPILFVENDQSGTVTYVIQTPIAGYSVQPFQTGDRVFVENIIPLVEGEKSNLNSSEIGYRFADVISTVNSNPFRLTVRYPDDVEVGFSQDFQGAFSSLVNEKIYPKFQVNQSTQIFIVGERLSLINSDGSIQELDLIVEESTTNSFKVSGNFDLLEGDKVTGNVSGVTVTVNKITKEFCRYLVGSSSRIRNGWTDNIGFTNDELQVTPDNDYYQNLSYSIKSTVDFETLIGPVNRLVHPAGLKNFSDTKIESVARVGFATTAINTDSVITLDFIGLTDVAETPLRVDRINTYDLGYDLEVNDNRSNGIRFNSFTPNKRLSDFIEVKTNRVLLVDDVSDRFVDSDNIRTNQSGSLTRRLTSRFSRAVAFIRNPFTDQTQLTEIITVTDGPDAFTMQKGSVFDGDREYVEFNAVAPSENRYRYKLTPTNPDDFDFDVKLFTRNFTGNGDDRFVDIGYVRLSGDVVEIQGGQSERIFRANTTSDDGIVVYATVTDGSGSIHYYEVYAVELNGDTFSSVYSFDGVKNSSGAFSTEQFNITVDITGGGRINVFLENTLSQPITVEVKGLDMGPVDAGNNPVRFKRDSIPDGSERGLNLLSTIANGSTSDSSILLATLDEQLFQAATVVCTIKGSTVASIHQVMIINSDGDTFTNAYPYMVEGPDKIGTFQTTLVGGDWVIEFVPDPSLPNESLEIVSYFELFYREYDEVNYVNKPLKYETNSESYQLAQYAAPLGLRADNTRFPIEYQGIPIFEKVFEPIKAVDIDLNRFRINDHFFSQGEEIYYEFGDSVNPGSAQPIEIVSTNIPGIGVTDKLPSTLYVIKVNLNRFRVAATKADAEAGNELDITGLGSGNAHIFGMKKKLEKSLFTINGVVQSPIAQANKTYTLDENVSSEEEFLTLTGIGTITAGDILLIEDEFVIINDIGLGEQAEGPITNTGTFPLIKVERGAVGSIAASHSNGTNLNLYRGSYNIVDSNIFFTEAPNGRGEQFVNDGNIVETNSTFQGRVFLQKNYDNIAVFDDISDEFNGIDNIFSLTSAGVQTNGVENGGGVLIINDIYQTPTTDNNQGNNYFFTNAEITFKYEWSDGSNTTNCPSGIFRISDGRGTIGLGDFDATGVNRLNYFNTLTEGNDFDVIVNYGSGTFTFRGERTNGSFGTRVFGNGSIIDGTVPADGEIEGTTVQVRIIPAVPELNVVFTGVTSSNGQRVESRFDVNQNQIPRGGLVVSLGSTPGLGYAPLSGAIIEPDVSSGGITGVFTEKNIGDTTGVQYATYDETTGELVVTAYGPSVTSAESITGATYFKESGRLLVDTSSDLSGLGVSEGDIVVLSGLRFTCPPGSGSTTNIFPDKDSAFVIEAIINNRTFSVTVGVSTIDHTYDTGGTFQKVEPFLFGRDGDNPDFVYLNGLRFTCPPGSGNTTNIFPDQTDYLPVVRRDDAAHWRLFAGISSIPHTYDTGGTIGQITLNSPGSGYNSVVSVGVTEAGHTGAAASIRGIPGPGGELTFVVDNPGTGYSDPYLWVESPNYFNLPIIGVSRRSAGLTTETGKNLFVTCEVGGARTTAVGRSEYFEVNNFEITNQGYGFEEGDVIRVVGLVTDKRLSDPLEYFELTVESAFKDNFSYWNYGEQDYIDSIKELQDGVRKRFPLIYNGEIFSFETNPNDEDSAAIDLGSILLIYVNTVLQTPILNYTFNGGASFEFTRAPLPEDDIDIFFFRGERDVDSTIVTNITPTIKPGDDLQIRKNDAIDNSNGTSVSKTQNIRTVTEIASSNSVRTGIYVGDDDLDTVNPRPVAWDKQKRDIFIFGQPVYKTRDSLESFIRPTASIIKRVFDSTDTEIYVDDISLFKYEDDLNKFTCTVYGQDDVFVDWNIPFPGNPGFRPAILEAVVDNNGEVDDILEIDSGSGYPSDTIITIAPPVDGVRAVPTYTWDTTDGELQNIRINFGDGGSGYTQSNPPRVIIEQPQVRYETGIDVDSSFVVGYNAVITRIVGSDPGGAIDGQLEFFFTKTTEGGLITDLSNGDYVVISNTFVGSGVEAVGPTAQDLVGFGNEFLDCVYQVSQFNSFGQTTGSIVVNVETNVNGIDISGDDLGNMSWGKISAVTRTIESKRFIAYDPTYTDDMRNFPTLVRTSEGLRNQGGIDKTL